MLLFVLLFVVYAFALPFVESNRGPNTVKLWRIKLLWILLVERCVFYPIQEIICLKDIKQEAAFKFNLVCNIRSFLHAREVWKPTEILQNYCSLQIVRRVEKGNRCF